MNKAYEYSSNTATGHTKVTLPYEEAIKAPFPPGCKVLCFDENGFRVGVIKDVLVFISLHEAATYGTYYEVEIKGANLQVGKTSVFTASDLRLTPDCPVSVSHEYFGSVFNNVEEEGNIEGIVLGSFEIPPTKCANCSGTSEDAELPTRRFFYSVRVKFPGMDEAVEAHGVPSEHIKVLSEAGESSSFHGGSIMLGGGSYNEEGDFESICQYNQNNRRERQRRMTPEDMHDDVDFDQRSVRDGFYQENEEDESFPENYQENHQPRRNMLNVLSNPESHFYDSASESGVKKQANNNVRKVQETNSPVRGRSNNQSKVKSNGKSSRSISRTHRTYVRSVTPVRSKSNRIPNQDDHIPQEYIDFKKENRGQKTHNEEMTTHQHSNTPQRPNHEPTNDYYDGFDKNDKGEPTSEEECKGTESEEIRVQNEPNEIQTTSQPNTPSRNETPVRQKFGNTWSPSNESVSKGNDELSKEHPGIGKLHIGATTPTPLRIRTSTPQSRSSSPTPSRSEAKLPESIPIEGCYLLFDSDGGKFVIKYSRTEVNDAIGFWSPGPGKKLQGFKFKQNQGRSDLMRGVGGSDYKKKYYSGWCQFVKAAKSLNGYFVKHSEREHAGKVDVFVFFIETCEIVQIEDGKLFDVSQIAAIACVSQGNPCFNGVKTGEYGTFLNKGAKEGASLSLL